MEKASFTAVMIISRIMSSPPTLEEWLMWRRRSNTERIKNKEEKSGIKNTNKKKVTKGAIGSTPS